MFLPASTCRGSFGYLQAACSSFLRGTCSEKPAGGERLRESVCSPGTVGPLPPRGLPLRDPPSPSEPKHREVLRLLDPALSPLPRLPTPPPNGKARGRALPQPSRCRRPSRRLDPESSARSSALPLQASPSHKARLARQSRTSPTLSARTHRHVPPRGASCALCHEWATQTPSSAPLRRRTTSTRVRTSPSQGHRLRCRSTNHP